MVRHYAWLNHKADMIEAVLSRYRFRCSVAGGTVSPSAVTFYLKAQVGTKVSKVAALAEKIATALGAREARIYRQGSEILIQVPRRKQPPEPKPQSRYGDDIITVEATPVTEEPGSWQDLSLGDSFPRDRSPYQLVDSPYEQWR